MSQFRVLIVDDTKAVHTFVKALLKPYTGFEFVSVFNGSEGTQLLEKDKNFQLILLDWEMPVQNGPETLKIIIEKGFAIPVMMMTTKNLPEEIAQMLEAGAGEYLMKPFTEDILIEKIERLCERTFQRAA